MNGILKVMETQDIPQVFHKHTNGRVNIQANRKQRNFLVFKRHISVSVDPPPQFTLGFFGCLNENVNKLV